MAVRSSAEMARSSWSLDCRIVPKGGGAQRVPNLWPAAEWTGHAQKVAVDVHADLGIRAEVIHRKETMQQFRLLMVRSRVPHVHDGREQVDGVEADHPVLVGRVEQTCRVHSGAHAHAAAAFLLVNVAAILVVEGGTIDTRAAVGRANDERHGILPRELAEHNMPGPVRTQFAGRAPSCVHLGGGSKVARSFDRGETRLQKLLGQCVDGRRRCAARLLLGRHVTSNRGASAAPVSHITDPPLRAARFQSPLIAAAAVR